MIKDLFFYYLVRVVTFPLAYMPYSWIRFIAKALGSLCFYLVPKYRKRTLSNLALAKDLKLNEKELLSTAKKSFQNLAIILLEYARLYKETKINKILTCDNPHEAVTTYKNGKGVILFCGHQSNFETLFLHGNTIMKGVAIARPLKNKFLYNWIVNIRQKTGGRVVNLDNALYEGLKSLKHGNCLGIVGDQALPDSNYSYSFLGRTMWVSTATASIAYKTNSPIFVATTTRINNGYQIHYSNPIWPNKNEPIEIEQKRIMDIIMHLLEESIKQNPHEWLWQHNCYKQQTLKNIKRKFRHDAICIVLPKEKAHFDEINKHLPILKQIYFREFFFAIIPKEYANLLSIKVEEKFFYQNIEETLIKDYRFKLIFDFLNYKKIKSFYKKLSAHEIFTINDLQKMVPQQNSYTLTLGELFQFTICRIKQNKEIVCPKNVIS
jgi:KDO2-lipid IV(A) lauroyltransferase